MLIYEVSRIKTPLGELELAATLRGLVRVRYVTWPQRPGSATRAGTLRKASAIVDEARLQLEEYLAGTRHVFNLPLDMRGSLFQQKVWLQLLRIPFGQRLTYGEVARAVGRPGGAQAVGQAVKENPIPIIVPCHRVVPTATKKDPHPTGGYNGGRKRKVWLLDHERSVLHEAESRVTRREGQGKTVRINVLTQL